MRTLSLIPFGMLGFALFMSPAHAQFTNPYPLAPLTKLESFDTNTAVVVLKGSTEVGAISAEAGDVAVKCREITDTSTGHKEQGISIEIALKGQWKDTL